jgi:hypothetical protein
MTDTIIDFITGKSVPDVGAEANRQKVERILVEEKGYHRQEIRVDEPIRVTVGGLPYDSSLDLVVFCRERPVMAIRCVAGSIGSFEREILAGARLVYEHQIPFSVSTDGKDALVRDTLTGKPRGQGFDALPSRTEVLALLPSLPQAPFPETKKEREMILFRSFAMDRENKAPRD